MDRDHTFFAGLLLHILTKILPLSHKKINKKMRTFLLFTLFFSLAPILCAQSIEKDIKRNPNLSAHTYLAYPNRDNITYTEAPKGYIPFHIEHYGRHGSRWLTSAKQYSQPVEALEKAEKYNLLTPIGKDALRRLKTLQQASHNREGELTPLGAKQHHDIARRMTRNFPQVFADSAIVDARATIVIRCILSMTNACNELNAFNPHIAITTDASNAEMYYMNFYDDFYKEQHDSARAYFQRLTGNDVKHDKFIGRLISDKRFATDSIDGRATMEHIFDLASNMQSHDFDFNLYDIFTQDEIFALWNRWNKFWYLGYGNSAEYGYVHPYIQRNLLNNIIESADKAILSERNGASLRFGHEICVLPLAVLMKLGDCNKRASSLKNLHKEWIAQNIFPMASNIQIVFYRHHTTGHILVKALLNEEEVSLPANASQHPYYEWDELKNYYIQKLQEFSTNSIKKNH